MTQVAEIQQTGTLSSAHLAIMFIFSYVLKNILSQDDLQQMEMHSLFKLYSFWYPVSWVTSWGISYYAAQPYNLISSQTRPHGSSALALVFTYVSFSTHVCSLKVVDTILPPGQTGLPSYLSLQVATLSIWMRSSRSHAVQIKSDRMNTNNPDQSMHKYCISLSLFLTFPSLQLFHTQISMLEFLL